MYWLAVHLQTSTVKLTAFLKTLQKITQYLGVNETKIDIENALNEDTLRVKVTVNQIMRKNPVLGTCANSGLAF